MQAMNEAKVRQYIDAAAALGILPDVDRCDAIYSQAVIDWNLQTKNDAQGAPIWAEKLRSTFPKLLEVKYSELAFEQGKVLPIDTRVDPAALKWEYFQVEEAGCADWIDEDGHVMSTGTVVFKRFEGRMRSMGFKYDVNQFDVERFQAGGPEGFNLIRQKQKQAVKAHARLTNWTWGFGEKTKGLQGLCNNTNISKLAAPTADGSSSRLIADKSADEVMADFKALIFSAPENTNEEYQTATVILPHKFIRDLTAMRYPGDRYASVWEWIKDTFSGDDSGAGKVTFVAVNECDPARRRNPKTGVDDSGITGYFMLALPANDIDERAFIRARPLTQLPPRIVGFSTEHWTHSKIGGCKMQTPLAVTRMDFGT